MDFFTKFLHASLLGVWCLLPESFGGLIKNDYNSDGEAQ
jgi:hypothetical protein